ncbi:MAG: hypothetical protein M3040_05540 [Bacteroidota bacterium]|nr:hypothetical protein [Bacteroidota bacterium]
MALYKIPKQDFEGFSIIHSLSIKSINAINNAIRSSAKTLTPTRLVEYVSDQVDIEYSDLKKVLQIIYSLSTLRKDDGLSKEDITSSIIDSLKEIDEEPFKSETKWDSFQKKLLALFTHEEKINLGYKAMSLAWEYDKIFVDSRIMTDIRPVFEEDADKDINSSLIVHHLKIEYHYSNDTHKKVFITLDADDLNVLKEQISRAEKKEKNIRAKLNRYFKIIDLSNQE